MVAIPYLLYVDFKSVLRFEGIFEAICKRPVYVVLCGFMGCLWIRSDLAGHDSVRVVGFIEDLGVSCWNTRHFRFSASMDFHGDAFKVA